MVHYHANGHFDWRPLQRTGWTNVNRLYLPDSIETTSLGGLTLRRPQIKQSKRPLAW